MFKGTVDNIFKVKYIFRRGVHAFAKVAVEVLQEQFRYRIVIIVWVFDVFTVSVILLLL